MSLNEGLNREQARAMKHGSGPALVVAGAGTGKTTVITRRIAWLIREKKAAPEGILALTFTDKAAREMEERVDRLVPYGFVGTNIETFHALGDKILRDNALEIGLTTDFRVMTNFQQVIFLRQLLNNLQLDYYTPLGNPYKFVEALLSHFSRLKDEYISPARYLAYAASQLKNAKSDEERSEAARLCELAMIYQSYLEAARQSGQLDFGDQIYLTLELFEKRPNVLRRYQDCFKYILVDEFQDTNLAQSRLMELLAAKHDNLMVVGDDDQSIYRFRGAAISNILHFKKRYPAAEQIVLTKNYRSTQAILDVGYKLISHNNPDRLEITNNINKRLLAVGKKSGAAPVFNQYNTIVEEMDGVAAQVRRLIDGGLEPRQIAILIRKNNQARLIMRALDKAGITSQQSKSENLFERPEVKAAINFVNVVNDPSDSKSLYGLLAGELFDLALVDLADLVSRARHAHIPLEEYLLSQVENNENVVKITTILESIIEYRKQASELSAGELIYKFINDYGYLKRLIDEAEMDNLAAFKVQNLAEFFEIVREYEAISHDPHSHGFWRHLSEIRATDVNISATDSPLDSNMVQVLTVHKAKGLEFEAVFMIDLVDQTFPSRRAFEAIKMPEELMEVTVGANWHTQEERRLFYVGLTRAKTHLYLSASFDHGGKRLRKTSPFVLEAMDDITIAKPHLKSGAINKIEAFAKRELVQFDNTSKLYRDGWLHLNPHQIEDYLNDPKEFWFWHILNVPKGPFHALVYGSAIHRAIEFYYRAKLNNQPIAIKQLHEVFEKAWASEGFVSREHEANRFDRGKQVIAEFFKREEKKQDFPVMVEQEFSFDLPAMKVRISGRYDAVYTRDDGVEICDFKTSDVSDEATAKKRLKENIQMAVYALAWEKTSEQALSAISLNFVEHNIVARTPVIDQAKTIERIEQVVLGIRNKDFRSSGRSRVNFDRLW